MGAVLPALLAECPAEKVRVAVALSDVRNTVEGAHAMTLAIAAICGAILLGAAVASALRYAERVAEDFARRMAEYGREW